MIDFWFGLSVELQFAKDDGLDAEIRRRFGALRDSVADSAAAEWRDSPAHLLAAVILLDQFTRNLHRDTAEAFAADRIALELTLWALDHGWELELSPEQRVFFYMPLMHAESPECQTLSVARFEALGIEENARFAREHAEVFRRFGRFPSRNAALGRVSTPEEQEYLEAGGGW